VLAYKYLGEHIDVHGGGMDLMFPHHENEIAQSEAHFGGSFAKYWMHNAFVLIQKEKMSKSLNNFYTLRDVFKEFEPRVIRFYYLNHHYRAPIDFAFEDIHAVAKAYNRLAKIFVNASETSIDAIKQSPIVQKMCAALADDLNTPALLGVLFEHLDELQNNNAELGAVKGFISMVLGVIFEPLPEKEVVITPEIEELLQQREAARKNKEWSRADQLRDQLRTLGFEVQDKKK
jgi:cysteinyl-tRNA synthetase